MPPSPLKAVSVQSVALDALAVAGAGAIVWGAWQIYGPAGWVVAGVFALGVWALKTMAPG